MSTGVHNLHRDAIRCAALPVGILKIAPVKASAISGPCVLMLTGARFDKVLYYTFVYTLAGNKIEWCVYANNLRAHV